MGNNPTFEGVPQKQVEAYVLDEDLDLYDHVVEVEFVEHIRGMVAFTGIEPPDRADRRRRRAGALDPAVLTALRRLRRVGIAATIQSMVPDPSDASALGGPHPGSARHPARGGRTCAPRVAALSPIVTRSRRLPAPAVAVGVLGMLPPVCFAVFGILAPAFPRRGGLETVWSSRSPPSWSATWCGASPESSWCCAVGWVIAFAGVGVGNVLLPPLVKGYFPDRIGLVTSLYATVMSVSTLVPPLIAVPVADTAGWRVSLGMWARIASRGRAVAAHARLAPGASEPRRRDRGGRAARLGQSAGIGDRAGRSRSSSRSRR